MREAICREADSAAGPVFVLGMNGSGTTMLLDSLGRHPALYAFPEETLLIPHLIRTQHRFGDLADDENFRRLWSRLLGLGVFVAVNGGRPLPLPPRWRDHPRRLAAVLDAIYSGFAAGAGKRRWCEKTPQHVQHMDILSASFPHARFIHIVRDGRDSAASFNRRWGRTPELTLYRWKKVVRAGRAQGQALGAARYLEIRYEELTADPQTGLRRVCAFIGEHFDAAMLVSSEPYLRPSGDGSGDGSSDGSGAGAGDGRGRLRRNSGNWRARFSPRTISRMERIGGAALAEFGYESAMPGSDFDPPAASRRIWSLRDHVRQYARQLFRRASGKSRRPWRTLLSRPFVAYLHQRANKY